MKTLAVKRILAFAIDYAVIAVYALALWGVSTATDLASKTDLNGQLIAFLTLTLPVFLYFFLMEKSKSRATLGKRAMKISVSADSATLTQSLLMRNLLKFLPWEIAHTGVHRIYDASSMGQAPSLGVWVALVIPQIIIIGYVFSIFMSKGESSFYDNIAKTRILKNAA